MKRWLLLFLLSAGTAGATILPDWDLPELTRRADVIAAGTVSSQQTVKVRGQPFTESVIRVDELLYGRPGRELVISQFGGVLDGVRTRVHGDAELQVGARYVLFVDQHEDGRNYLVGMSLGARSLAKSPRELAEIRILAARKRGAR